MTYKKTALALILVGVAVVFVGIAIASIRTTDYIDEAFVTNSPYAVYGLTLIIFGWLIATIVVLYWLVEKARSQVTELAAKK
jgi:uncharacterized membrane protein YidH (DUF202 family)